MLKNSDEVQKLGTDNMKMAMKSFGVMSKASGYLRPRSQTIRRGRWKTTPQP
jgi:hypothetical protein